MKNFNVNVLGLNMPIKFFDYVCDSHGNRCAGIFKYIEEKNALEIHVSKNDNKTRKDIEVTVLHECGHALLYRLGFNNTTLDHNMEELIVDGIGTFLSENWDFEF